MLEKVKLQILYPDENKMVAVAWGGCGNSENNKVTMTSMIKEDARIILEGMENRTYESTAELFSADVKENYPMLNQDIAELMEYLDGEIVSHEGVFTDTKGGHSTDEGWIEKGFESRIINVKTNTNKTYNTNSNANEELYASLVFCCAPCGARR